MKAIETGENRTMVKSGDVAGPVRGREASAVPFVPDSAVPMTRPIAGRVWAILGNTGAL